MQKVQSAADAATGRIDPEIDLLQQRELYVAVYAAAVPALIAKLTPEAAGDEEKWTMEFGNISNEADILAQNAVEDYDQYFND